MNRREFGKLIAALRKEHFDPVVGKVWTQQMLAEKSGLLPRTIGEIERGQKATLEAETLLRLAAAFRFTTLERREFFAAATEVDEAEVSRDAGNAECIFRELWGTMGKLYLPAVLHDAFFDLLAVNALYRGFHNLPAKLSGTMGGDAVRNVNFLSLFFGPHAPLRTAASHSWRTLARSCVRQFRTMTLRYRHTRYFQMLFEELCQDREFNQMWTAAQQAPNDQYSPLNTYHYHHAQHGSIRYTITVTPTVTPCGTLYLAVLVPGDAHTGRVVVQLAQTAGVQAECLSPWPNPALCV